jgi:hypothetical protein
VNAAEQASARQLVRRSLGALDTRSYGLWLALAAALILVFVIGAAPTMIALGLLALLVVD